ncbi:RHS repeat-associated core domain-containing protein [Dysgonomonas sp.]|uniref:RHS repeat domain-containing protein n=1 Tax=Dysgonomonas sp. TaxID=1891233 RepID=UPI002BFA1594|nr:RHS repeat-associated core domain-containing protein [Dysgonomonas sp.]HMM04302.1 RHS repeat-associated core domain-containing protein [Dysgonomonas sp.]
MMDIKSPVAEARNEYTYSASGQKLKVVQKWNPNFSTAPVIGSGINTTSLTQAKTSDYTGNIIYENNALKRILVDGGYYEGGVYYYYLTDHLGNNRVVANASGTVTQINNYYPFGMHFAPGMNAGTQPYMYNGKELDMMHGLNMYDYSARYYESALGRFTSVDPLAEKYYSWSPYAYCYNNPLRFIDPDGKQIWPVGPLLGTSNPMIPMGRNISMMSNADKIVRVGSKSGTESKLNPARLQSGRNIEAE